MKNLPAILLNQDFFEKPRNRKWIKDFGFEALGILQIVWIASSKEKNCKIRKEDCFSISYPIPLDDSRIKEVLDSAVLVGLLDEDSEHYYNSQIVSDSKAFKEKQNNYKKAAENRKKILQQSSEDSEKIVSGFTDDSTRIIMKNEYEDLNTEDLKKKEDTPKLDPLAPNPPSPVVAAALERWKIYQKTKFQRDFDEIQADAVRASFGSYGDELAEFIDVSIGSGWRNIKAVDTKRAEITRNNGPSVQKRLSPTERGLQAAENVLRIIQKEKQANEHRRLHENFIESLPIVSELRSK